MTIGSPASALVVGSAIPFVPAGNGSVPTKFVDVVYGTFVLNEDTPVTVADAGFTASSIVVITLQTVGGTVGAVPALQTVTPGTGFTVAGTTSDTSTYSYVRIG